MVLVVELSSSFFGHFSHRSEWQLIKIDYKGLFSRRCMDGDYQTWHLHNKVTGILNIIDLLSTVHYHCKQRTFAWHLKQISPFLTNTSPLAACLLGGAVCHGWEANLYEAQARQPLHVGSGLFQDLLLRALPLYGLWFWMVMPCLNSLANWPWTKVQTFVLHFCHYMCISQPFSLHILLYLINSCLKTSGQKRYDEGSLCS